MRQTWLHYLSKFCILGLQLLEAPLKMYECFLEKLRRYIGVIQDIKPFL